MLKLNRIAAMAILAAPQFVGAQTPVPTKAYTEEWVYRVRLGHQDEWWKVFQHYDVAELEAFKRSGQVLNYAIYRANLHTDEAARWDYRVIVTYRDIAATNELRERTPEVQRRLFPDAATHESDERRRWDLTLNHWDLPIVEIDPRD